MKSKIDNIIYYIIIVTMICCWKAFAQSGWYQQNSGTTNNLNAVSFVDENIGIVVGDSGTILRTIDGGNTWFPQTSGTTNNLKDVVFINANIGTVVGEFSTILRTTDGGLNWSNQSSPVYRHLVSVSFVDADHGIIVGSNGCILRTTNGGALWTNHSLFSNNQLSDVSLIDSSIGIAVGSRWDWHPGGYYTYIAIIVGTSDGGNTWIDRNVDYSHMCFTSVTFNANIGITIGGGGQIVVSRSTDTGNTWFTTNFGGCCPFSVSFPEPNIGIVVGLYGSILRTSDGGSTWTTQTSGVTSDLYGVYFSDTFTGTAVGTNGTILRTIDGGIPVELTSFTTEIFDRKVLLNWSTVTETNNQGFEVERSQKTEYGSKNWEKIGFVAGFGTTTEPKSYSFTDENVAAGKYTYRLKQIDYDGGLEYSEEVEVEINNSPTEFALYQNYPNPFNPTTTIIWQSPVSSRQTLKVYDVLGNEVVTLVDEEKEAGVYEINFNADNLSSGIYYYQLQTENFSETKKLLLLK